MSGDFLIDGSPASRLPENITKHEDFTRIFESTAIVVRPVGGTRGRFVCLNKHHEALYTFALKNLDATCASKSKSILESFYQLKSELELLSESELKSESESKSDLYSECEWKAKELLSKSKSKSKSESKSILNSDSDSKTGLLLVTEKHEDSSEEFLLVPSRALKKLVPKALVINYSHWLNISKNTIDFRPIKFNTADYISNIDYQLNVSSGHLFDVKRNGRLVSINSFSFYQTQSIFNRIELPGFIQVICDVKNGFSRVIVDLHRLNLQFEVTRERSLRSLQYSNMCVSMNQKRFGVLIGFIKGLLIEPTENFADVLSSAILIPHPPALDSMGNINDLQILPHEGHQKVDITLSVSWKEKHLQYFKYDVDTRLRQLRAPPGVTASVFLARLHASTASPLPEPFTGLTGTEMALQILQSGHCWFGGQYEFDCEEHLKALEQLAPVQKIDGDYRFKRFPEGISSLCAHAAFNLTMTKLKNQNIELPVFDQKMHHRSKFLYSLQAQIDWDQNTELSGFNQQMYYRSKFLYSPQAQIDWDFESTLNTPPTSDIAMGYITKFKQNAARVNPVSTNLGTGRSEKCCIGLLKQLLITLKELRGSKLPANASFSNVFDFQSKCLVYDVFDFQSKCLVYVEFPQNWFTLYTFTRMVRQNESYVVIWQQLLSGLVFPIDEFPLEHLLLLHAVALHPDDFPDAPLYSSFKTPIDNAPNEAAIANLCEQSVSAKDYVATNYHLKNKYEPESEFSHRILAELKPAISADSKQLFKRILHIWPIDSCCISDLTGNYRAIDIKTLHSKINDLLSNWFANRQLDLFVDRVEQQADLYISESAFYMCCSSLAIGDSRKPRLPLNYDLLYLKPLQFPPTETAKIFTSGKSRYSENKATIRPAKVTTEAPFQLPLDVTSEDFITSNFMELLQQSWNMALMNISRNDSKQTLLYENIITEYSQIRSKLIEQSKAFWQHIESHLKPTREEYTLRALSSARLTPAAVPFVLLQRFLTGHVGEQITPLLIGAYVVLLTLEMRATRIVRLARSGPSIEAHLRRELENAGHQKWSPAQHPEWLLFELERDLLTRPVQINVAERMAPPPGKVMKNSIVQLQMGEGKTAVIVPLLILQLADGTQLCRLTVMQSLFQTNARYLRHVLGGLLNRRVYSFSCNRETKIDSRALRKMYEECMSRRGVVIALPEERLSFHLKAIDECIAGRHEEACDLYGIEQWLRENSREILDEAEEVLNVKFQLIYTVGSQRPVENEQLRWQIAQSILSITRRHMSDIEAEAGHSTVELHTFGDSHRFPVFRLLQRDRYYEIFCQHIVKEYLVSNILQISSVDRTVLIPYLTEQRLVLWVRSAAKRIINENASNGKILLNVRGLLAGGLLFFVLNRRWRVNYGVDSRNSARRKMAIPFRAKDIPMHRTEFGHVDVAILFTLLSYYYSGLSDEQIESAIACVAAELKPADEYSKWIAEIRPETLVENEFREWNTVDLHNSKQRLRLFPLLKYNKATIDYWLGSVVFPTETQQFPQKLVAYFWDLVPEDADRFTTGFSGTNDTQLLYPPNITQNDLKKLKGTNGELLRIMLLKENDSYIALPLGADSEIIIKQIISRNIRVILDVGALIIDCNNEQLAVRWLELVSSQIADAVVYFDSNDKLVVYSRGGSIKDFDSSPYALCLNKCLVYLDEFHTRGTDLRIPADTRAALTLGPDLPKDRLFQAAMRMRLLGAGHSISFVASHEVDSQMKTKFPHAEKIGSKQVIEWSIGNSVRVIREGLQHWAIGGLAYLRKKAAREKILIYSNPNETIFSETNFGLLSASNEFLTLNDIYGDIEVHLTGLSLLEKGICSIFCHQSKLCDLSTCMNQKECALQICSLLELNSDSSKSTLIKIFEHFTSLIGTMSRSTACLEEQQQRELQQQVIPERQNQLCPVIPFEPAVRLSDEILEFVQTGRLSDELLPLPFALRETTLWPLVEPDVWGDRIRVSEDFTRVVKDSLDKYLRPPNWIVSYSPDGKSDSIRLVVISPFEANELIPMFRSGALVTQLRMFAARLHETQDLLFYTPELSIPPISTQQLPYCELLDAELLVFSGTIFFSESELFAYYRFLGVSSPLQTPDQQNAAFDSREPHNSIAPTGSLADSSLKLSAIFHFVQNPCELAKKIIELRFGSIPLARRINSSTYSIMNFV